MDKTKAAEKALPESMYFLVDEDSSILGPFNEVGLKEEIEDHDNCYWEDMKAFVVSCDGEKLVYQDIDIEELPTVDLIISPRRDTL